MSTFFERGVCACNYYHGIYEPAIKMKSNSYLIVATVAEATGDSDPSLTTLDCAVVSPPLYGTVHIVFPLNFTDGTQWVLKVPSSGHPGEWSDISARV